MRSSTHGTFAPRSLTSSLMTILIAGTAFGCASLGPKANVSLVQAEISSTKKVENIVITPVTGIDASGNTGKALLASNLKAYGMRARPLAAASAVLSAVGAPDGLMDVVPAGYQAAFIAASEAYAKNPAVKPTSLVLPSAKLDFEVPAGLAGAKALVPKLKDEASNLADIAKAMQSRDSAAITAAIAKSGNAMALVQNLNDALFEKLDVTYILLTHVSGDEQAWNGGKKVSYSAGLLNIKTGKLRYFATVDATKGAIPTPYMAQLGMMAANLFDAVNEQDPLPEAKAKKTASVKAKKGV